MIPIIIFISVLTIIFGVMALVLNSSRSQKMIDRRLLRIRTSKNEFTANQVEVGHLLKVNPSSKFGWFEEAIQEFRIVQLLQTRISQADCKITVVALLLSSFGLALLGFFVASLCVSFVPIQIVVACLLFVVPVGVISFLRSRRISAFNAGLADAIDMMARSLRAGHSMVSSINIVAEQGVEPVSSEFGEVFKQQNFGLPLRDAFLQMLDHVPSQDLRVLVTGILVQKETGGNLTEILDRTAAVIRERLRIQGEIKTHTAQGRMTGYILCSLPVVMLVVINFINPGYSDVLLKTPTGHMLIYLGLFLLVVGALVIRQIVNGIEV